MFPIYRAKNMAYLIGLLLVLIIGKGELRSCNLDGTVYICRDISRRQNFPSILPEYVHKVTLIGTDELRGSFPNGLFQDSSWLYVSELSLLEFKHISSIDKSFLDGLKYLRFLSISACNALSHIDPEVFHSTPDLEALYFDGNRNLRLSVVENALRGAVNKLKYLSLQEIQMEVNEASSIGRSFFSALKGKNITYLDVSYANIAGFVFDDSFQDNALYHLRYFNGSYSTMSWHGMAHRTTIGYFLQKLEVVDFSGCQCYVPILPNPTSKPVVRMDCGRSQELKYLFLDDMVMPHKRIHLNYEAQLIDCNCDKLEVIDLSNNKIIHLNLTISGKQCFPTLVKLDLSRNDMEYISTLFLRSFSSLKILDMSENELHKMEHMDDFSYLLRGNMMIEVVLLRKNHLSSIPNTFLSSNTKLVFLDLRENDLTDVSIDFSHILNLKFIDLGKNQLGGLPSNLYETFELLHVHQENEKDSNNNYLNDNMLLLSHDRQNIGKKYSYGYNSSVSFSFVVKWSTIPQYLSIDLSDNPIECNCENAGFLKWGVTTKSRFVNGEGLICNYRNTKSLLDKELYKRIEYDCQLTAIIVKAISATTSVFVSLSIVAFFVRRIRRKKRRAQDVAAMKREIKKQNHRAFNYIAFIPFCSRDYDVVKQNALPALMTYLKKTLNTDKDVVCTGMDNFRPGMLVIDEIHRCIDESLVVVPIITPAFIQSAWSQNECVVAIQKHRKVLILMEEHTDVTQAEKSVKNLIEHYTRATWSNKDGHFIILPSWDIICDRIITLAAETMRKLIQQQLQAPDNLTPLIEENSL